MTRTVEIPSDISMELLRLLSDGRVHSGGALGQALSVSRTAIWKAMKKLEPLGITVQSVKGVGYQLAERLELLDQSVVLSQISRETSEQMDLTLLSATDSTNTWMAESLKSNPQRSKLRVVSAEMQTSGRGRRGRSWISPFARNLYFSVGCVVDDGVAVYEGLSLAVGVVLAGVLESYGVRGASLKWPNDLLYQGGKLAGVLIEVDGDLAGECRLVVGVGVNCNMTGTEESQDISQSWRDLNEAFALSNVPMPSRSVLLGAMAAAVGKLIRGYPSHGFSAYRERWQSLNAYAQAPVRVVAGNHLYEGICQGVSESGALEVLIDNELRLFNGGEVSLRLNV